MNNILTKYLVATTDDFTLSVEFFRDRIWMHSDVLRWNKRVKKQFIQALDMVQGLKLGADVYAVSEPNGWQKREKFMRIVGFFPVGIEDFNGLELPVYRRPLPWVTG